MYLEYGVWFIKVRSEVSCIVCWSRIASSLQGRLMCVLTSAGNMDECASYTAIVG